MGILVVSGFGFCVGMQLLCEKREQKLQKELEQTKREEEERKTREQNLHATMVEQRTREQQLQKELEQAKAAHKAHEVQLQKELQQAKTAHEAHERQLQKELEQAKAAPKAREQDLYMKLVERRTREQKLHRELEQAMAGVKAREQDLRTKLVEQRTREQQLRRELEQAKAGHEAREQDLHAKLDEQKTREQHLHRELEEAEARHKAREKDLQVELEQAKRQTALQNRAGFVWEWQGTRGEWCRFVPEDSKELTEAFLQGKEGCEIVRDRTQYKITLAGEDMQQQNCRTQRCRKIRVVLDLPEHWGTDGTEIIQRLKEEAQAQLGPLTQPSVTFETETHCIQEPQLLDSFSLLLRESFFHDLPLPPGVVSCPSFQNVVVREVHQVMNYGLLRKYEEFGDQLRGHGRSKLGGEQALYGEALPKFARQLRISLDAEINEQLLLHGTSFEVSQTIAMHGWDSRLAKNGLYGRGTYFAVQSCKSHQYTKEAMRTVLLARVALGNVFPATKCDNTVCRPPDGYDSVVAKAGSMPGHQHGVQTHTEFIIFQHAGIQAIPEYIIRYSLS